jgi:hypothetical protein
MLWWGVPCGVVDGAHTQLVLLIMWHTSRTAICNCQHTPPQLLLPLQAVSCKGGWGMGTAWNSCQCCCCCCWCCQNLLQFQGSTRQQQEAHGAHACAASRL